VGEAARGEQLKSKPGTRVDKYSHHEQEKLVLQVSKKRVGKNEKERVNGEREAKGEVNANCIHEYPLCVPLYVICK
jgi:hypothetical protein